MLELTSACVFCGSSPGHNPVYTQTAATLGRLLASRQIRLIYGGGKVGLMGALADACLQAGGKVTGIMPRAIVEKEIAHRGLTDLRVVNSMHERKALMADLAGAFIALPGGFGTWEEFCEIVTWTQLGIQRKPCAILNVTGYYDALFALADHAVQEGFLRQAHRDLVLVDTDPERLLDSIAAHRVPVVDKWILNGREIPPR